MYPCNIYLFDILKNLFIALTAGLKLVLMVLTILTLIQLHKLYPDIVKALKIYIQKNSTN